MWSVKHSRRGVTLLEVLFAIFVAAIGLLALAALVPLGKYHAQQAVIADRAGSLGRQATRDIEARGMLRYRQWLFQQSTGQYINNSFPLQAERVMFPSGATVDAAQTSFLIDPLFITFGTNRADINSRVFPYSAFPGPRMARISLPRSFLPATPPPWPYGNDVPATSGVGMTTAQADAIFRLRDELSFQRMVSDPKGRPELLPADGKATRVETLGPAALADDVGEEIEGEYSWAVMVTPAETEAWYRYPAVVPNNPQLTPEERRLFHVAVLVFHRRDFSISTLPTARSERQIPPFSAATGRGVNIVGVNAFELRADDAAGLAFNEWIMLSGVRKPVPDDPTNAPRQRVIDNFWYRILSIGRVDADHVFVRVEGPDWNTGMYENNGAAWVTVVPSVVAVHQRTIELDVRSLQSD
ncbi:MAG: prepilin-type N-terminal cleavage/methylation domain-containing protein [Planctomycetia bacterium]|nr:prepilin-type N-terminal cleavage/methylation domain-containing protein [Planctomycetia bacterium]